MTIDPDHESAAELLRQALADEAAGVQPDPQALQAIQQRTAGAAAAATTPTTHFDSSGPVRKFLAGSSRTNLGGERRWPPGVLDALGVGVATAAIITAVVVIGDRSGDSSGTPAAGPGPTTASSTSAGLTNPTASAAPTTAGDPHVGVYDPNAPAADQVTLYYFGTAGVDAVPGKRPDPRLYPERHTVLPAAGTSPDVTAVHEFLTSTPIDPDYSSGWPAGVDVSTITRNGAVTTIDLVGDADVQNRPAPHPPSPFRLLAVQALLATAGVEGQAAFTYNGEPVDYLFYEPASVTRQSDDEVRAWVSITSPVEGQTVDSPVTVTGSANVFEANVNWELMDTNGKVVDSGNAMAGFTEWKPFSIDLGKLPPGSYTIRAFESSPRDGRPTQVDDKTFTVH